MLIWGYANELHRQIQSIVKIGSTLKKFKMGIFRVQNWKQCVNEAKEEGEGVGGQEVCENTEQRNDVSIAPTTRQVRGFL